MKNLIALPRVPAYLDRYIAIRDRKHGKTRKPLVVGHQLIVQRYLEYDEALSLGSLERLKSNAHVRQLRDPLRACYDSPTQPLNELKKAIKGAQTTRLLKYCPMCGTTLPSTFDHYLPAVRFPEFSVHPLNLVPCCSICNSTKDDDWLTNTGTRQYLHVYSDQLPDMQFVSVMLHEREVLKGVGATFSIQRPANMKQELWVVIESHFQRLNLIDRFQERSNDEIAEILSVCRVYLEAGGGDPRAFLKGQAQDRTSVYGRNHWIAVLMEAMANHSRLPAWVDSV